MVSISYLGSADSSDAVTSDQCPVLWLSRVRICMIVVDFHMMLSIFHSGSVDSSDAVTSVQHLGPVGADAVTSVQHSGSVGGGSCFG